MIVIEKKQINDIPVLHIVKQQKMTESLPLVFFIHGFSSIKETNLNYAYLMADKGFRVVLPEALHHGERNSGKTERELSFLFWEIVLNTIHELEDLKQAFIDEGLADPKRIGLAGTSMGAIITLGALRKYDWIKAAVSLMGHPAYEQLALWQLNEVEKMGIRSPLKESDIAELLNEIRKYDLSLEPEKLKGRPVLFWHGKLDPVVPFDGAYDFYESIRQDYNEIPENLKFIADAHAGHKVSQAGIRSAAEWFEKHL
ncbi:alpha/beta fold hydrolase [Mesobacillus foraminis]|uniref:Peptidase S9 prolyl oligopeptidase catalytic domain-containing protein n=1 Tax=Mesobacillus foraminis TaxID=279826 RepID=A0A4R2BKX8_9BACI|nr:alpha/beta fold hydrolase [Mesobacillus foraminis]TCN27907.1 hypothetical protein EV146_101237 [Mesobacillus foraminis]